MSRAPESRYYAKKGRAGDVLPASFKVELRSTGHPFRERSPAFYPADDPYRFHPPDRFQHSHGTYPG